MPHRLPTPYEMYDDICTLLTHRFDNFADRCAEWTNLLKAHLTAVAAERWDLAVVGSPWGGNGVQRNGLLWMDGGEEAAAIAWHWQRDANAWNLDVLDEVLRSNARLKVFLTDSAVDFVNEHREDVTKCLAPACSAESSSDVLVVIFCDGGDGRDAPMAKALRIVRGCSEQGIPRRLDQ